MKQKLTNILEDLEKPGALDELWKNLEKQNSTVKSLSVELNAETGKIDVKSQEKTNSGQPVLEWTLDTHTGDIVETTRNVTTDSERVVEKTVDVESLHNPDPVPVSIIDAMNSTTTASTTTTTSSVGDSSTTHASNDTASSTSASAIADQGEIQSLRDSTAFKLSYSLMIIVMWTLGLIYAYIMVVKKDKVKQREA